ncbi:MAG: ABC transporter substrate-binding protein [Desulfobacterales bacterium]|nr:ABC transporter substrate-binding protein [Desulfobacterales bacterium]
MIRKILTGFLGITFLFCLIGFSQAAETIKVGAPVSLTGAYAADGLGSLRGVEMAVNEINDAGGLLGKKLEIVKFDTQELSPERVMQAADYLIGQKKVDSAHGGWAGWGQDVRAYGKYDVPFFMFDASINSITVLRENLKKYSNVFQLDDTERPIAAEMFKAMYRLPVSYPNKKVAIISADDSWGMESAEGFKAEAEKSGWTVPIHETVPYGTREWGPILTKIREEQPAIIYVEIVYSPDLITFFRQFLEDPTNSLINLGYGLTLPDFLSNIGSEGDGLMGETTGLPGPIAPTPESKVWVEKFKATYNIDPAAGSFAVYNGVMIWAESVKAVGDVKNYKAINAYIAENEFKNIGGKMVKFDEDHKITTASWPLSHIQIQDGELITIYFGSEKYLDYKFQTPSWMK